MHDTRGARQIATSLAMESVIDAIKLLLSQLQYYLILPL